MVFWMRCFVTVFGQARIHRSIVIFLCLFHTTVKKHKFAKVFLGIHKASSCSSEFIDLGHSADLICAWRLEESTTMECLQWTMLLVIFVACDILILQQRRQVSQRGRNRTIGLINNPSKQLLRRFSEWVNVMCYRYFLDQNNLEFFVLEWCVSLGCEIGHAACDYKVNS